MQVLRLTHVQASRSRCYLLLAGLACIVLTILVPCPAVAGDMPIIDARAVVVDLRSGRVVAVGGDRSRGFPRPAPFTYGESTVNISVLKAATRDKIIATVTLEELDRKAGTPKRRWILLSYDENYDELRVGMAASEGKLRVDMHFLVDG